MNYKNFKWQKLGRICRPLKNSFWTKSYCMLPTPLKLSFDKFRIFYSSRNIKNQSYISFTDESCPYKCTFSIALVFELIAF